MNKFSTIYIIIITLAAALGWFLFITHECPEFISNDIYTVVPLPVHVPDTSKPVIKIVYKYIPEEEKPSISAGSTTFSFLANFFEDGHIWTRETDNIEARNYILTQPFSIQDTWITAKKDTIHNIFGLDFNREKPIRYESTINYSPDSLVTITKYIETVQKKQWYDEAWFRYGSLAVAYCLGVYSGIQIGK